MPRSDRGQVLPLFAAMVVVAAVLVIGIGALGRAATDTAAAASAADVVALAAAVGGEQAARDVATANGARILELSIEAGSAQVTVAVGEGRATARATTQPRARRR